jgi:hypothetical protein
MSMLLALIAIAGSSEADQRLLRLTNLYEQVCLKTFPDDKAVEALMAAQKARELPQDEVKVTMRDDPARAWELADGGATVWIEFPPYHACSVRWNTPSIGDLSAYRLAADKYERAIGGFSPTGPYDDDQGPVHVHAVGEQRILADNSAESLFIFDQQISDPKRREAGETGVVLRFVHQFAPPPAATEK